MILTITCSILSPIATYFFQRFFQLPGPGAWLSLSLYGIKQGWVWQPLTYFFLQSAGIGLSLSLILSLFFQMLLLWFAGSEIDERFGAKKVLFIYLSSGLISGIISALFLYFFSSTSVIVGSSPAVAALLVIWAMLYPELELFFLFLLRIKAKWLIALYLGFSLLMHLSSGAFIPFLADFTGMLYGFLIGHFYAKLPNPFPLNLEFPRKKKKKEGKIIDITQFQEDDDAFMDRMLDKVAKQGESSLSQKERDRMKKISESKSK